MFSCSTRIVTADTASGAAATIASIATRTTHSIDRAIPPPPDDQPGQPVTARSNHRGTPLRNLPIFGTLGSPDLRHRGRTQGGRDAMRANCAPATCEPAPAALPARHNATLALLSF